MLMMIMKYYYYEEGEEEEQDEQEEWENDYDNGNESVRDVVLPPPIARK